MNTLNQTIEVQVEAINVELIQVLKKNLAEVEAKYRAAMQKLESVELEANYDELTGLLRRKAFVQKWNARKLSLQNQVRKSEVFIMMIDIDHFKKVNDTYGHQVGDEALERVSALVKRFLAPSDYAGRFGGEEIIVAMFGTREEVLARAESLRQDLMNRKITSRAITLTMSAGLASAKDHGFDLDALVAAADASLYEAKHAGRNQILVACAPSSEKQAA